LEAKGLEYDATVVVSPSEIAGASPSGSADDGASDSDAPQVEDSGGGTTQVEDSGGTSTAGLRVLYVALTRATQRLTGLSGERDRPDASGVPELLRD
jgi:ATP-dependent exoDNAse (exonuclease V) beta subunit